VLSAHTLLIAAIFVPYMGAMAGLILYACWLGEPRSDDRDGEPPEQVPGDLPAAA
jgi:hypothetical protein